MSTKSFKSKIISSAALVSISHLVSQLLRLSSNLVLTRLLVPEMFGLMSIAYAIQLGLSFFSDIGLSQNLVQSDKCNDQRYVNTLWTLQVIRGLVIFVFGILVALALYALNYAGFFAKDTVYASDALPLLIIFTTFNSFILGFVSTNVGLAIRNLNLYRKTIIDLIGQVLTIASTIAITYHYRSIWSLVVGALIGSFFTLYASYRYFEGPRNNFEWNNAAAKDIINFGQWVFLSSIIGFLSSNGDRLVLGGLISASLLGLYSTAFFFSNSFTDFLNKIFGFSAFPALSQVYRDNPQRLKEIYYKLRLPTDIVCLFSAGILFKSGHLIIEILYDERYRQAGEILEILSLSLLVIRYSLDEQCYLAMGLSKLLVFLSFFRAIAVLVFMPLSFHYFGFKACVYVVALNGLVSYLPIIFYNKIKFDLLDVKKELIVLPVFMIGMLGASLINYLYQKI